MAGNIKVGIGLQVCRPDKLSNILHHLSLIADRDNFHVEIAVDRRNINVENMLYSTTLSKNYTGGIGNWTSKNFLIRKLLEKDSDVVILLEDDIEILKEGMFEYIKQSYLSSKNFLGYFKVNSNHHKNRFRDLFIDNKVINGISFDRFRDLNTSALLVLDKVVIERIGYFCNSYYEVGFHDYRQRLYGAKLIENFLVPSKIYEYIIVDDSIPSTVSPKDSAVYWNQKFEPSNNWYRPYIDHPALIL